MKYFIDTEFIEGPQKEVFPISLFRKETPNTIDLISIGIVAEDGREYYAISKDFNLKEAWNRFDVKLHSGDRRNKGDGTYKVYWLRENVLRPIYYELVGKDIEFHDYDRFFTYKAFKNLIDKKGKTNKEIAEDVIEFCKPTRDYEIEQPIAVKYSEIKNPEFYAYYADYDWVVFCWLFGKMIDLPKGFPMYCNDLKQILDSVAEMLLDTDIVKFDFNNDVQKLVKSGNIEDYISCLKNSKNFPKQTNEHNALVDARWNKKLFEFLMQL
jgi:hypothetical protein